MPSRLAFLGLASPARLRKLTERLEAAERRASELKQALSTSREETQRWKTRAAEVSRQLASAEKAVTRLRVVERELSESRARVTQLRNLKQTLVRAERTAALSQEHLLATETKLDVIEGALTVLDLRTRSQD